MRKFNLYIILVTFLGLLLRLININKPEGLWNDEYVSWMTAATPFGEGFWDAVIKQCHAPFYYLFLKPFAACDDLTLRLTSVFAGILAIPVMYYLGNEFSKKVGKFCALITAVLSFLIYYSQEVRFYSILFLFSAISVLFTIKVLKESSKFNWFCYVFSLIMILFTHIIGCFYVFANLGYVIFKKKILSAKVVALIIAAFAVILPFGINVLKMTPSSQWWGNFSYTNILFLMSDFFSPILTNNVNAPQVFYYNTGILFAAFITIPTILALIVIVKGAKELRGLICVSLVTILATVILALCGKLVFITKYNIEVLPIFILAASIGFEKIKFGKQLFICFIAFHLFAVFTPFYTAKTVRSEGHKLVGDVLNYSEPDIVIFTYYEPDRFKRYIEKDFESKYISKINRFEYIDKPEKIAEGIKSGQKVSMVFLDSVSFLPENIIPLAEENGLPEMFITFSKIRNSLTKVFDHGYGNIEFAKNGSWTIISATKR